MAESCREVKKSVNANIQIKAEWRKDTSNIDVNWHKCDIEGCNMQFNQKSNLKRHKASVHNIVVDWHECDIEGRTESSWRMAEERRKSNSSVAEAAEEWRKSKVASHRKQLANGGKIGRKIGGKATVARTESTSTMTQVRV